MEKRPAHPPLNDREYTIAAIAGVGLTMLIGAATFSALGTTDNLDTLNLIARVGAVLVAIGAFMWWGALRPWQNFDDLQTPYYTGHHDDHHDPAPSTHGQAIADHSGAGHAAHVQRYAVDIRPDNLQLIEGIGSKIETALHNAGVFTFHQLAAMSPAEVQRILREQNVKAVAPIATFPTQAYLAAKGDANELREFQSRIENGYVHDFLVQIEGIGAKIQDVLYEYGIRTFVDLVMTPRERLDAIMKEAGIVANTETWQRQAQYIVDNDLNGLKQYQDSLRGGRPTKA